MTDFRLLLLQQVTEMQRCQAPDLLQYVPDMPCVNIRDAFQKMVPEERSVMLALLIELVCKHLPSSAKFLITVTNLIEDILFHCDIGKKDRALALEACAASKTEMGESIRMCLENPLFEMISMKK